MSNCDIRLAGICRDCIKRLGIDERVTSPLNYIQVSQLPKLDPKTLSSLQFPAASIGIGRGGHGTTKITYKIAKTVKESIDDAASNTSLAGHSNHGKSKSNSK